ncbi:MAG: hypothetical protein P1U54_02385 [Immundisolibacteraceae bacterium]|nr:hypothetical protein [Immundisolibacteraceae bacterium]
MKFIQRVRIWLQKPWFVGVLSAIAILFSARNIVLPLMEISSGVDIPAATVGGLSNQRSALIPMSGGVDGQPVNLARLRHEYFNGSSYQRNPFLLADDPRQPGNRSVSPEVPVISSASKTGVIEAEVVGPERLFALNAILIREGKKYALVNRQVSGVGDLIEPSNVALARMKLTSLQRKQAQQMLEFDYRLQRIGQGEVEISSPFGDFMVSLEY